MTPFTRLAVLAFVACAHAQYQEERAPRYIASEPKQQASTPVPILKQINRLLQDSSNKSSPNPKRTTVFFRHLQHVMNLIGDTALPSDWHNEDGSYTYGYEAADGSFKIETKSPTGDVKGKYGYKDDSGKVRVVEYGANKYGFQPAGEGITVAPPTLVDETTRDRDDGGRPGKSQSNRAQYRPAPAQAIDYDYNDEPAPPRPAPRPAQQYRPQPAPQPQYRAPAPQAQFRAPPPTQQPQFRAPAPTPQPQYRPAPQPQQQYRQSQGPAPPKPAFFAGAAPAPTEDNFFNPEPPRRQYQQPKQDFRSQFPELTQDYSGQSAGPSQLAPRPHQQPYSMLDQLLKEYALPSNGAPALHDITFGTY